MNTNLRMYWLVVIMAALALFAACDDDSSGPNDVTSPARVTNLTVIDAGENSLTLQWTAPGDDGGSGTAQSYQIRRSLSPITESNFGSATLVPNPPAPAAGGTTQQFTVTGVDTLLVTHFALRAVDEVGNTSQVSNDGVWRYDTTPPSRVVNLDVVAAGANSLTLQWTAPGDDGNIGTATRYEIRRSNAVITVGNFSSATLVPNPPTPSIAGTVEQFTVTGIDTTITRHFALRAYDELDNASQVSNDAAWIPGLIHLVKDIPAFKDNTMYAEWDSLSNGAGANLFAGRTAGLNGTPVNRRALLAFAIADSLPAGAIIDSVALTLHVSKVPAEAPRTMQLHRLTANWGEAGSDAGNQGGAGAPAQTNDATWGYRFYKATPWTSAGGDFNAAASAQAQVGGVAFYTWTSVPMVADVQGWLNNPTSNFGWILIGDESVIRTAKQFESRENPDAANRPKLRVYYSLHPVPAPGAGR